MILKESKLNVADTCGIFVVKCFHIYQNKKKKWGNIRKFIKVSYREMLKKLIKLKGRKSRAFFYKSKYQNLKYDGSVLRFATNSCVLTKRRLYPRGKISEGVVMYSIKRKKFITSFRYVL